MADFIKQPHITLPNTRVNTIHHFVKTFVADDPGDLDDLVNAWTLSLETLPNASPITQHVNFSTILTPEPMSHVEYCTQIHYILVT